MALPKLFGAKKAPPQTFLALDIGEEAVSAGLWTVDAGKVKLLKTSSAIEWKDENVTDLAEAADVALEELGKEGDSVEQIVLGLPESWVENHAIAPSRKVLLKTLNEQLTLKPMGFVVTGEALVEYLKELEGGPISAVLVQFTAANLSVSMIKAGKIGKVEVVGRSGKTIDDLTEAFTRLGSKSLPARVVLYGTRMKFEELENEKQGLMAHDWQASGFFLHIPKIEALPQNIAISAVSISGGSEVAASLGLVTRANSSGAGSNMSMGEMGEESGIAALAKEETLPTIEEKLPSKAAHDENFGFTEVAEVGALAGGAAVATAATVASVTPSAEAALAAEAIKAESDSLSQQNFVVHQNLKEVSDQPADELPAPVIEPTQTPPKVNPIQNAVTSLKKTFNSLIAGRTLGSKFRTEMSGGKTMRLILIGVLVVLVAGLAGAFFFVQASMTADVIVTLKTIPLTKDVEISIDPTISASDPVNSVLKVHAVQKEITGNKQKDTTGASIVGDKAKGKVTIFNATSSLKTFPAGTVITSPGNLKFTLDTQVVVASSSGSASSIQPGKADVNVTASAIGTNSNLGAKTEFSVANFDKISYVASNDNAFTGGSSRDIQAVSKKDIDQLKADLQEQLKTQAQQELQTEIKDNGQVLPTIDVNVKDSSSDAEVGDEVKTVTVTMTVVASAYSYTQADLLPLATALLKDSVPQGALLQEEKTLIAVRQLTPPADETALPVLSATLTAQAIPAIDRAAFTQAIQGKTIEQAQSILKEKPEVAGVEVQVKPSIAKAIFNRIPAQPARIIIQTKIP